MKLSNFLVVAAMLGFAACSSPYRATDGTVLVAPAGVQTAFVTQYPTATNVVWTNYDGTLVPIEWDMTGWTVLDDNDYLVRFDVDNEPYYAWYDDSGNWVGTAYVVKDYNTLPSGISTTLTNQYSGYTISGVNREYHKDRMLYEVELKNSNTKVKLLMDGSGNIVKQKSRAL